MIRHECCYILAYPFYGSYPELFSGIRQIRSDIESPFQKTILDSNCIQLL